MISQESLPSGTAAAAATLHFLDRSEQEEACVELLDYQEAHSVPFDGLVWDNWHHYTD